MVLRRWNGSPYQKCSHSCSDFEIKKLTHVLLKCSVCHFYIFYMSPKKIPIHSMQPKQVKKLYTHGIDNNLPLWIRTTHKEYASSQASTKKTEKEFFPKVKEFGDKQHHFEVHQQENQGSWITKGLYLFPLCTKHAKSHFESRPPNAILDLAKLLNSPSL